MDPQRGIQRRTLLKTSAWAVPTISLAMVAPLASASNAITRDLGIYQHENASILQFNADRSRAFRSSYGLAYRLGTHGDLATPPGATVTLSFDNRIHQVPAATFAGISLAGTPSVNGHRTTVLYPIPIEIPASAAPWSDAPLLQFDLPQHPTVDFYPDPEHLEPFVVSVLPPAGIVDQNNWNDLDEQQAQFVGTWDLTLKNPVWRDFAITRTNEQGATEHRTVSLLVGVTVANIGAYATADGFPLSVIVSAPELLKPELVNPQATVGGVPQPIIGAVSPFLGAGAWEVSLLGTLQPGHEIALSWDLTITSALDRNSNNALGTTAAAVGGADIDADSSNDGGPQEYVYFNPPAP